MTERHSNHFSYIFPHPSLSSITKLFLIWNNNIVTIVNSSQKPTFKKFKPMSMFRMRIITCDSVVTEQNLSRSNDLFQYSVSLWSLFTKPVGYASHQFMDNTTGDCHYYSTFVECQNFLKRLFVDLIQTDIYSFLTRWSFYYPNYKNKDNYVIDKK